MYFCGAQQERLTNHVKGKLQNKKKWELLAIKGGPTMYDDAGYAPCIIMACCIVYTIVVCK